MKHFLLKPFIFTLLLITLHQTGVAQLVIDDTQTPQQLVQNVLLGNGVTASNITFTGISGVGGQIGSFTANGTNLGLTSGIVMVTGPTANAIGPNGTGSQGLDIGPPSFPSPAPDSDPDLDAIANVDPLNPIYTNDAAVLEFDFVPTSDTIKFRYVFGSEEYPEFVGSINDVFAFFLTGPGGYNNTNIALIPGTSIPISIATVNNTSNIQYYVNNDFGATIQFDGFTTVLTAVAAVQCGQSYHIKLAIADASDGVWDSGVFLEAGSFSSPGAVEILPDVSYSTNDTTMFEGCGSAAINFVRRNGNLSQPMTITYDLGGTATNGVDYPNIPTTITIPANDTSYALIINPLQDGVAEGIETIIFSVTYTACNVTVTSAVTIYLNDVTPLTVDLGPDQFAGCNGSPDVQLTATTQGGAIPVSYLWSPTGDTLQSITVTPANTTTYIVSANDVCGNSDSDTIEVVVQQVVPLALSVTPDMLICQNDIAAIEAFVQGGTGTITLNWSNGITTAAQNVSPSATTTYIVTVSDQCNIPLVDSVRVDVSANNADFDWIPVDNNTVQFDNQSVGFENGVLWDFGDNTTSTDLSPTHDYATDGVFPVRLIVENANGCLDTITYNVIIQPEYFFYIPNAFTPDGDGVNETFGGQGIGFDIYNMRIFNRWGEQIFESSSTAMGWDGKGTNGKYVMSGIYLYEIRVRVKEDQDPEIYRGKVTLMR